MKLPPVPASNQPKLRKSLSITGLLALVRKEFEQIKEHRIKTITYQLADVLMSALAMFGLKYPSLLRFEENRHEPTLRANLKNLYGVERAPSDTQMREILDPVAPEALRVAFRQIHRELQRQKVLEKYRYLGGYLMRSSVLGNFLPLKSSVMTVVVEYSAMERYNTTTNYWLPSSYTQNKRPYCHSFPKRSLAKMVKLKMIVNETRRNDYSPRSVPTFQNCV